MNIFITLFLLRCPYLTTNSITNAVIKIIYYQVFDKWFKHHQQGRVLSESTINNRSDGEKLESQY